MIRKELDILQEDEVITDNDVAFFTNHVQSWRIIFGALVLMGQYAVLHQVIRCILQYLLLQKVNVETMTGLNKRRRYTC